MSFDPSSLLDVSYLLTFLGGTAVGAAGTYFADRFTDQRRKKETINEERRLFSQLERQMPNFFAEIRQDLLNNSKLAIREFVVLPSEGCTFNHTNHRFEYYESTHEPIFNFVSMLIEAEFVKLVRDTSTPIYRLSENFVEHLTNDA